MGRETGRETEGGRREAGEGTETEPEKGSRADRGHSVEDSLRRGQSWKRRPR